VGYSVVLFVLLSALSYFIFSRADVEATILRLPGMLYQRTDDGMISNLYNVQIANKTFTDKVIELRLESMPESSLQKVGESAMLVEANGLYKGTIIVKVPGTSVNKTKMTIEIGVYENDIKLETVKTNFLGPVNQN
jgi:hypothetical protein